jgi:two-component system nitrogen regulation response regulator GlnG
VTVTARPVDREQGAELLGEAPAMQEVFRAIGRLARSAVTVLITGESGTGKELVARALHRHSPRAARPFVALNTAAIPTELLESELFGHERGAFTGATQQRRGRFEQADGGTLFLDEIGDMPLALQTRLLRVLAEGEFYRVGGVDAVRVDVRIIAATHQDLERKVADGAFRADLYHRLNVVRVRVPALRERPGDLALLAEHFMLEVARELGVAPKRLSAAALAALAAYAWPGNVRELQNLCRRLTVLAPSGEVQRSDLPDAFEDHEPTDADWSAALATWARNELEAGRTDIGVRALEILERSLIDAALEHTAGRRSEAAERLGWGRNTLTRKLKR